MFAFSYLVFFTSFLGWYRIWETKCSFCPCCLRYSIDQHVRSLSCTGPNFSPFFFFFVMFWFSIICIHDLSKKYFFRWCHDIGREQAANKPLLKTVFQVNLLVLSANLQHGFYKVSMVLNLMGLFSLRSWCDYSVLAKQLWCLWYVTRQGCVPLSLMLVNVVAWLCFSLCQLCWSLAVYRHLWRI